MIFDNTLWSIIGPAFIVSLLVAATHVPLGLEVLKRGIIFIDLATAQIAGLGAVAATLWLGEIHSLSDQILVSASAFGGAIIAAIFFSWIERKLPEYEEALIGCSFVLAASMALLLLANQPQGGEDMRDLLAGQILWTNWSQVAIVALVYVPVLVAWLGFREKIGGFGFYLIFAITITTSVQIIGVYLVFALLIFPALGANFLSKNVKLGVAYGLASVGILLGLISSIISDYPTGPMLVWSLALVSLLGAISLPKIFKN